MVHGKTRLAAAHLGGEVQQHCFEDGALVCAALHSPVQQCTPEPDQETGVLTNATVDEVAPRELGLPP